MNDRRRSRLLLPLAWIAGAALAPFGGAVPQSVVAYKAAVVALTDDTALRAEFERGLVAKAVGHDYDAITSFDLVPNVADRRLRKLAAEGARAVLMLRPAAIGAGSSTDEGAELISSGAVWLDEPLSDRAEGVARWQDLVVANVDAARPAIRRRLGLPAL